MNFSARKAALTSSFLLLGLGSVFPAYACWAEIGQRYNINPYLLGAIAKTESNFKANAVRQNKNGTRDIGVMQINSLWLPELAKYGNRAGPGKSDSRISDSLASPTAA